MEAKIREGFFSSEDQSWATPWKIFNRFNEVFNFKLDPCAAPKNAKHKNYFTKKENGLLQDWSKYGNTYVNPPFREGNKNIIPDWVKKSYRESLKGITVCMLIPARPDTGYWHDYCLHTNVLFIKGRIVFESSSDEVNTQPPFFPSALVVFGNIKKKQMESLSDLGVWMKKSIEGYFKAGDCP